MASKSSTKTGRRPTVRSSSRRPKKPAAYKPPAHYAVSKSDGDAAVQAWIDLLPDWQSVRARRVDPVVTRHVPKVHKAVRWHGVWYGVPERGWFLAMASFKAHLKLVFFDGARAPRLGKGLAAVFRRL